MTADGTVSGPGSAGQRLFARYAHAPNALGYCGPATAEALQRAACGDRSVDVRPLARQFSGAWPYQCLIAELTGDPDPLSEAAGRAYWTGNDRTDAIDRDEFGRRLLERFGAQAGHYWQHLDDGLLPEAAPTHIFHVLGVYPWSRLLGSGRPEPLHVLDSCRIRAGVVEAVDADKLMVTIDTLVHGDGVLSLDRPRPEEVGWSTGHGAFIRTPEPGEHVAVHWGFACDLLTPGEAGALHRHTCEQLDRSAPRLATATG